MVDHCGGLDLNYSKGLTEILMVMVKRRGALVGVKKIGINGGMTNSKIIVLTFIQKLSNVIMKTMEDYASVEPIDTSWNRIIRIRRASE